ncbi:sensor histidine kinase [Horticoccus sp. 23ND18S-11]|uniref:sensor histidine kinase n=1 Tax=Horticoccus sp. 23ND18S-11 TaxID=3391832 RepID=UPI0039C8F056
MAPIGADGANICSVLARAGMVPQMCRTNTDLRAGVAGECGAILLTEEALTEELRRELSAAFAAQPPWSDIPVIMISSVGTSNSGPRAAAKLQGPRRTVTLIERPLRSVTLLATLNTVLAARRRQYEIRDLLNERDQLLSSLESRVAQRTVELQRMVEEMEAFSYSVSHDLRSPLRSLAGYARALQEDYAPELPPLARHYLEKITRAAQRMDNLTQDVLAYTRATQGEIEIGPVDLDNLVKDVIEQYPALGSLANRIQVRVPLGGVLGHVPSLVQCFSNLLGNAMKFVPDGRVPEIIVSSSPRGGFRRISVTDNGVGIDPAHHQRIFGMFERAARKDIPGTGIGLAIVKKAVERMGGCVGVSSTPGQGAEFWIELRATDEPSRPVATGDSTASYWAAGAAFKPAPGVASP